MSFDDADTVRITRPAPRRIRPAAVGLAFAVGGVLACALIVWRADVVERERQAQLRADLASGDPEIRERAVLQLRDGATSDLAGPLLAAVRNARQAGQRQVESNARMLLVALGPDVAAPVLVDALAGKDGIPYQILLRDFGMTAATHVTAGLTHTDGWARARCAVLLADMGVDATDRLIAMRADTDHRVRYGILEALVILGAPSPRVLDTMRTALEDEHVEVRTFACGALARLGIRSRPVLPRLLALVRATGDVKFRVALMMAIVEIDAEAALRTIGTNDLINGKIATRILERSGTHGTSIVERLMTDADRDFIVRAEALEALISGGHQLADRWLPHIVTDDSLALHAAKVIGRDFRVTLTDEVRETMLRLLAHDHDKIALAAARALFRDRSRYRSRDPRVLKVLVGALDDPRQVSLARSALAEQRQETGTTDDRLRTLTSDDEDKRLALLTLAAAVHEQLGEVGDAREVRQMLEPAGK